MKDIFGNEISNEVYYESRKYLFDAKFKGNWQKEYVQYILKYFPKSSIEKMLDHGFFFGAMTSAFRDVGIDIIGIECEQYNVDSSPFQNLKGRLFSSKDNKYPFIANESISFIHSSQVMEHIPEEALSGLLLEFYRILKPNGIIYMSTVGECTQENVRAIIGRGEETDSTHVSCFSELKWNDLFMAIGFTPITKNYNWVNDPMRIAHNWDSQYVFKK